MQTVAHEVATKEVAEHLQPLFDATPDGMYVWLDEEHWICNQRLAELFGYTSPDELNDAPGFLQRMVHEDDQQQYAVELLEPGPGAGIPDHLPVPREAQGRIDVRGGDRHDPAGVRRDTFAYHFVRAVG